jgi:glutamate-1-semialdehyde 2,1-aminomutase
MSSAAFDRSASRIIQDYKSRTPKSAALHARAVEYLPGGVSGNLRYFAPHPLYMSGGDGCLTADVDQNRYIDCFLCNGPLLLGHNAEAVVRAIDTARSFGSLVLNPSLLVDCAERLCQLVPCAEKVRFLNSGTEAVMSAVRFSRGFTGRSKVIKFFGHYHGQDDQFLVGAGSGREPFGQGIPRDNYSHTLTLPFNDSAAVHAAIADGDIAAVILDPAMHAGGLWATTKDYLNVLRELTRRAGVVLIFDEVITGFRLAPGGAQEFYGVAPDLVTLGKALGAGERLAAVAGRADILAGVDPIAADPSRRVFQSGTGNDSSAGLAAATAALDCYAAFGANGEYARLTGLGRALAVGLREAFADAGVPCHVNQLGSMLQLFLTARTPEFVSYSKLDTRLLDLFFLALMTRDVILTLPTSNHIYLSFAHTQSEVDRIIRAARDVIAAYDFAEAFAEST